MKIRIREIYSELDMIFILLFFLSFFHSILGLVFYLSLSYYWKYGASGGIRVLFFITTRSIMSTAVAAVPGGGNTLKWILLLGSSIWILLNAKNRNYNRRKVNSVVLWILLFIVIECLSTIETSSYPITSIFKLISFGFPLVAILIGLASTNKRYYWTEYIVIFYTILFCVSFVLIPFGRFRIVNNNFQGVFNHVNMLGIISVIYIALLLNSKFFARRKRMRVLMLGLTFIMLFLSMSRTGMFSAIAVVMVYIIFNAKKHLKGIFIGAIGVFILVMVVTFTNSPLIENIKMTAEEFIWKNSEESIWDSRKDIIESAQERFEAHKILGTGFMVPYENKVVDYHLNFDLIVEPGNLLWMLLGDTGIVGTSLFGILIVKISLSGTRRKLFLLVAALMVNMGEMVFFSSNNMSILLYLLIAIYIFDREEEECVQIKHNSANI